MAADLEPLADGYLAGELKPRIKSEAEPADNSGPVFVLTANNWEKSVVKGKTYLLEFYAPVRCDVPRRGERQASLVCSCPFLLPFSARGC